MVNESDETSMNELWFRENNKGKYL